MGNEGKIYKTLVQLKTVADRAMGECYIGSAWDVDKRDRKYPLMVIDNMTKTATYKEGVIILNLDIYIVDIYNEKQDEEINDYIIQVQSDMFNIGTDYLTYLDNDIDGDYEFIINKVNGFNFQMFTEKWVDECAGVRFDLDVKIPDAGHCENVFKN